MATARQKEAARKNLVKAREARGSQAKGAQGTRTQASSRLSTAGQNRLDDQEFAFPKERKEPLVDAAHVRNAVARFDQVQGVSDRDRDAAWKRVERAAARFDVEIEANGWRELVEPDSQKKR